MTGINAKDKTKTQMVGGLKIPELEGRVKIELFNAETRELEQTAEGKNLVTNAVRDILSANPFGITDYTTLLSIMDVFFGGILCFQNPLTENANNYYPPNKDTNPIVAHAGQTTYSSAEADATRGNPNDIESGYVTNGYKRVWDFASTQGNGTISALAMTHPDTGDLGMTIGNNNNQPYIKTTQVNYPDTGWSSDTGLVPTFFDESKRKGYFIRCNSSSVTVREYSDYGVQDDIGLTEESPAKENTQFTTHSFTITDAQGSLWLFYNGNIHCLNCSGSTVTRTIINTNTWETSSDSFSVSGATLVNISAGNVPATTSIDADGYVYLLGSNGKAYKVKYTNTADVEEITGLPSTNRIYFFWAVGHIALYSNDGASYIINGNSAYPTAGIFGVIDPSHAGRWIPVCISEKTNLVGSIYWTLSDMYPKFSQARNLVCKLFMSTVKNLETAVVKTSTQTMKITYTITEVQENS